METDLNSQDRKDLDKFIKFFALKTVQVIVQARLGEKICTRSSSSPTGSDWFNLAIKDIPEVTHEAKKALAGQLPAVGRSMCVEISLKTSEGDSMELEIWCLEMNEKCDKEIKVSYTVYNRLSLLLKSLLAITRVTPAYRLSRKQGHEYVILYRIYFGEVQLNGLGEGFQTVRVGTVGTPVGTITLSCAYRINLAFMSTRQFERTPPIMGIIIDHFVDRPYPSSSPMHPCNYRTAGEDTGVTYPSVEDSQEVCTTSFSTSPPSQLMVPGKEGGVPLAPNQPAHGAQADQERLATYTPSDGAHCAVTPSSSEDTETVSNSSEGRASPHDVLETIFVRKVGAFVNKPINQVTLTSLDIPFAMFAPKNLELEDADPMVNPPDSPETESPLQGSLHSDGSSGGSSGNTHDDFVMIDFKPAFSKDDILPMDLGTFYREFQNPPQLSSLSIDIGAQSMAEDLDSLPEKLAVHEKNVREFDAFVETLQ
ncbi:autophagy-related protein 13 isoform X16 [Vulpes vulpes]|uniref:Autophagy-related protein 13 n=4 Tax=Canidae TaxID=9608 RepID=A0A8C0SGP6_CANLF|nr:autophagy-related protein 13 isoform X8 [Canis lupus familiaris]XP_025859868.1 autophagy-related protein 13 isoform X10 [Vulpes vulpes]XP_035557074.1 autophagy-related protein 13 isoform X10 [Canis lupus dingo]XP_038280430.1 autophagy-related protein 13 isoform X8 [Canis lupus familiaris]XP_038419354.1 autophagy-related protein 13 isoform X8 [Canis lupus familiaris]XP_041629831.1 autophagy-related protein 13 isoform X6 [Vulpes lagopus]XP_048953032.1 autophagy-related protein 13 isoform X10|eukprot:XP_013976598.1 autophagy-related protein 13 isoform X7 [Canis lupus familiaris]